MRSSLANIWLYWNGQRYLLLYLQSGHWCCYFTRVSEISRYRVKLILPTNIDTSRIDISEDMTFEDMTFPYIHIYIVLFRRGAIKPKFGTQSCCPEQKARQSCCASLSDIDQLPCWVRKHREQSRAEKKKVRESYWNNCCQVKKQQREKETKMKQQLRQPYSTSEGGQPFTVKEPNLVGCFS